MGAAEKNIAFNAVAGASMAGMQRRKALFIADGRSFDQVMEAIGTNNSDKGGTGRIGLVFEDEETLAVKFEPPSRLKAHPQAAVGLPAILRAPPPHRIDRRHHAAH